MSSDVRLFKIESSTRKAEIVREINFAELGFQERRDIQEWIIANPDILGEQLLIIGKEFSGFDRTNERADIIAVDRDGSVVVVELKRDDTGADVHWQAIKYASYFQNAKSEDILRMLADFQGISETDAEEHLKQFLDTDDLDILNQDQRIMLVSHRFAPEVTSAVLWLNRKAFSEDLITCIQLTPYQDAETNALYIQSSTILPIPGTDELTIRVGNSQITPRISSGSGPVKKEDEVTVFLRDVTLGTLPSIPSGIRPDKKSRWAGIGGDHRYYHVWYSRPPWSNWGMSYQLMLFEGDGPGEVEVIVSFKCLKSFLIDREGFSYNDIEELKGILKTLDVFDNQKVSEDERWLELCVTRKGIAPDTSFENAVSGVLARFVETITPAIEEFENARNEQ